MAKTNRELLQKYNVQHKETVRCRKTRMGIAAHRDDERPVRAESKRSRLDKHHVSLAALAVPGIGAFDGFGLVRSARLAIIDGDRQISRWPGVSV